MKYKLCYIFGLLFVVGFSGYFWISDHNDTANPSNKSVISLDGVTKIYSAAKLLQINEMERIIGSSGNCMSCMYPSQYTGSMCYGLQSSPYGCDQEGEDLRNLRCKYPGFQRKTKGPSKNDECLPGGKGGCQLPNGWCVEYEHITCHLEKDLMGLPYCAGYVDSTGLHDGNRNVAQSCNP